MTLDELLAGIGRGDYVWGVKRLSANDVGLTGGHQAGIYLPAFFVRKAFGSALEDSKELNPRLAVHYEVIGRDGEEFVPLQVIYYNNKIIGGTRDEFRVTNWRQTFRPAYGESDYDCVFLFAVATRDPSHAVVFVARTKSEEERLQNALGFEPLAPKDFVTSEVDPALRSLPIPSEWKETFPSTTEISNYVAIQLAPWSKGCDVDTLVLTRRNLEHRLFKEVEALHLTETIRAGFHGPDDFASFALGMLNRRKTRSGRSLENILGDIFRSEGVRFTANPITELTKRPDFLFPSIEAYRDFSFPDSKLCMMGAKTTCKDRWRQILTEADRIGSPHLFTLDTALTEHAFAEMTAERVRLVMPRRLRGELRWDTSGIATLREFIDWRLWEQRGA